MPFSGLFGPLMKLVERYCCLMAFIVVYRKTSVLLSVGEELHSRNSIIALVNCFFGRSLRDDVHPENGSKLSRNGRAEVSMTRRREVSQRDGVAEGEDPLLVVLMIEAAVCLRSQKQL